VTRYADKSFSVGGYSPEGGAAFDRIFVQPFRVPPEVLAVEESASASSRRQAMPKLPCGTCEGTEVVPASGPGTKAKLVVQCPTCQPQEGA
jgi:hypothetical protein